MKCPFCNHSELKVTDSREAPEINAIRRRRECLNCQRRFTTFETFQLVQQVLKRDGRYEDFDEAKLIRGLEAACRHTTISHEQMFAIAHQITFTLMQRQVKDVTTKEIGEMVMAKLQGLDPIAYIRFACVYRRFTDLGDLMEAIKFVQDQKEPVLSKKF